MRNLHVSFYLFFNILFTYLFLERGEGREKEKVRNIDMWEKHQLAASHTHLHGGLAHNPGVSPDQESSQRLFSLQDDVHPTEPQRSGLHVSFYI